MAKAQVADPKLARRLILDELFDLSLYTALRDVAGGDQRRMLEELIPVETRHVAFWQDFFGLRLPALDAGRRIKLAFIVALCRVFGAPAIHLALEAIEVYGVRKYLEVWETYRDGPLGPAVREVLEDEFKHEDAVVTGDAARTLNPERIRNIFLGLNDGLVEILGAVSGFFGAFGDAVTVLIAGSTVAVAGALSMAAGAYVASSSEAEVRKTESARERFLGQAPRGTDNDEPPLRSAAIVGASYFAGALVPVLPVLFGAKSALPSLLTAGTIIIVVSMLLAFLSGMDIRRRVAVNVVIIAAAVVVTYLIGVATRTLWGITL
jgi:VIT1/CCC1 family predicted Fe2+/Mn2+ transporter